MIQRVGEGSIAVEDYSELVFHNGSKKLRFTIRAEENEVEDYLCGKVNTMKIKFECQAISDLAEAAEILTSAFGKHRVFAFYGEMGSGKTTFISAIVKELGSSDVVQSPTYSLVNEYQTEKGGRILHFDFYRLRDEEEAFESGLMDLIDSGSWCFIEWPERIPTLLPDQFVKVNITQLNDVRTFTMELTT
jgi:tRNA threonylcarbamoyladenosine biosynthesis protein TsaE